MNPKIKILFLELSNPSNLSVGGSFLSLRDLLKLFPELNKNSTIAFYYENKIAEELRSLGFSIKYLNYFSGQFLKKLKIFAYIKKTNNFAKNIVYKKREYSKIEIFWQFFLALINSVSIIRLILKTNSNLIYCNCGVNIDRAGIIAALILNKKVCCHLRNIPSLTTLDKFLIKKVNYFVAISNSVKDHYSQFMKGYSLPIRKIYNPIVISSYLISAKKSNSFISKDKLIKLGCFSRMVPWKGHELLINSFYELYKKGFNIKLFLFGDGPEIHRLKQKVKNLSISSVVFFKGFINDNIYEMNNIDILVNPSIKPEPLGRVVMEAMMIGRTVVSSNLGGPAELINNNFDGYLFNPNNEKELSGILMNLFLNPYLIDRIGKVAKKKAKKFWSNKLIKHKYKLLLSDLGIFI